MAVPWAQDDLKGQIEAALLARSQAEDAGLGLQRQAVELGQASPPSGNVDPKQALKMLLVAGLLHAADDRASSAFTKGYMDAETRRIEAEHAKAVQNLEKKRQLKLIEAQSQLASAGRYGDKAKMLQEALRDRERQAGRMAEIEAENKGRIDLARATGDERQEKEVVHSILAGKFSTDRVAGLEMAHELQMISDSTYERLKPIVGKQNIGETKIAADTELAKEKTADIKETRPARLARLLAEGRGAVALAEYRAAAGEAQRARAGWDKMRTSWYSKEIGAKIADGHKKAEAALISANASASRVLNAGASLGSGGKGVTPTAYFNAINKISDAQAKVESQIQRLNVDDGQLAKRISQLEAGTAKSVDPRGREFELAEIRKQLEANAAQRAYLEAMKPRLEKRLQDIKSLGMGQVSGPIPPFNPANPGVEIKAKHDPIDLFRSALNPFAPKAKQSGGRTVKVGKAKVKIGEPR